MRFPFFGRKVETRSAEPSWGALSGLSTHSGLMTNPRVAEGVGAVQAAVNAISTSIAALPAYVYARQAEGRELDDRHPLASMIRRGPNPNQTWPDFVEWLVRQSLLWGNGLAEIQSDATGRVIGLKPIPWWCVAVQLLPSGRLAYDVTDINSIYGGTGRQRRLLDTEVLHLKDATDDGLIGKSRLTRCPDVIHLALAVNEFAKAIHNNAGNPSGVVKMEARLAPDAFARLAEQFRSLYGGSSQAGKVMILDQGATWVPMSITPEDAELLESRRFAVVEAARLFNVPPPLIQDYSHNTFTNSEQANRWFATNTLTPWIRKLEAEFSRSVLADSREIEFDLSGLLRGDPEARWRSYDIALKNGVLDVNEVREAEGWNPKAAVSNETPTGTNVPPQENQGIAPAGGGYTGDKSGTENQVGA